MLPESVLRQAAKDLSLACSNNQTISPLTAEHSQFSVDDGYRVQNLLVELWHEQGLAFAGYKIGMTAQAAQLAHNHAEPVYGRALSHAIYGNRSTLSSSHFIKPRLEVELAYIMAESIENPDATMDDVLPATEFIVPAIEVVDHRIEPIGSIADAVADNSGFAAAVLADRRFKPKEIDAGWVGSTLSRNGVIEDTGVSAISMGHPATCVAWLARRLAKQGGRLNAGDIVLTGAITKSIGIVIGDEIEASFGPYGRIQRSFVAQ